MTEAKIVIRRAVVEDLDAILEIESAWPTTPHWSRAQFEQEIASERSYFCVCEAPLEMASADGPNRAREMLGYAAMLIVPPEAQITTVAVRPDCARSGVGRKLMEHMHDEARWRICSSATLDVSEANPAAIGLYQSLGYRIVGRRSKYYNHQFDALLMTCDLEY